MEDYPELKHFVQKVRGELPDMIRNNTGRTERIIERLEEYVLREAEGAAEESGRSVEEEILGVIEKLGGPKKAARRFTDRGTPKVYITEELWSLYIKVFVIAAGGVTVITVITEVFSIDPAAEGLTALAPLFGEIFFSVFTALLGIFTFVTLAFAGMSMAGVKPEDFRRRGTVSGEETGEGDKEGDGEPPAAAVDAPRAETHGRKTQGTPEFNPRAGDRGDRIGGIIGGCLGIVFGILLIVQRPLGFLSLSDPAFQVWLRVLGILVLLRGIYAIVQHSVEFSSLGAKRAAAAVGEAMGFLSIPLFLWLRNNREVIPIFEFTGGIVRVRPPGGTVDTVIFWVLTVITVLIVIGTVISVVKALFMKR